MDYQFNQPNQMYQPPVPDKRSAVFETAALSLGIASLVSCTCIYISLVLGALAIMFALLSRGGEMTMGGKAKTGLILGLIGIIVTIAFTGIALVTTIMDGSFQQILKDTCDMYGYDYESLFGNLFSN